MTCTQIILKFQYTRYCSPQDAPLYWIAGTWWKSEVQEKHLRSQVSIGWTEQQFPEVFSTVFGSTNFLQPYTVATQEERWAPITRIVNPNPVIWGVARAVQGTLPSAASPQNPLCRTQRFERQPGWAKASSWRTWNEQFETNSFRMSSSKFIHTSQAHQLKRNIQVYLGNTLKHAASTPSVALWLKWCNSSAALKIVFMGHVEPNLTVKF